VAVMGGRPLSREPEYLIILKFSLTYYDFQANLLTYCQSHLLIDQPARKTSCSCDLSLLVDNI
jgi:hypothetical protein